jgi:hypothetical protein
LILQEKQEKIQQLEIKLEEVEKLKTRAENRYSTCAAGLVFDNQQILMEFVAKP